MAWRLRDENLNVTQDVWFNLTKVTGDNKTLRITNYDADEVRTTTTITDSAVMDAWLIELGEIYNTTGF